MSDDEHPHAPMTQETEKTPICANHAVAASTGDADDYSPEFVPLEVAQAIERAANAMYEVMSNNRPECYGFHHERGDRHAVGDPCPLVERYNKALAAFAALRKEEGQ